ncbi:MAG: glycosyltransferase family 4 protein [bacterium]
MEKRKYLKGGIMKLIYVSFGNIPSKWAHTIQMMKMSEALAQEVDKFELVTMTDLKSFFRKDFDFYSWYGIKKKFKITRLPLEWKKTSTIYEGWEYPKFNKIAPLYCKLVSPDIVYTRKPFIVNKCIRLGVNVIFESHDPLIGDDIAHIDSVKNKKELLCVVALRDFVKNWYIDILGLNKSKIIVAPNAVSLENYNINVSKNHIFEKYRIPVFQKVVIHCGHLYENRGIDYVIECAKNLKDVLFLFIGGWSEDVDKYRNKTKELGNVLFTGFIPNSEVPSLLKTADCVLMPYSKKLGVAEYATPLKMFDYMASKVPIVASKLYGLQEFLKHDYSAILVEPDDWRSLLDGVKFVFDNKIAAQNLADNAYKEVEKYTYSNRAKRILEFSLDR